MASDHKSTSKADMISAIPDFPAITSGEPTMRRFLRVLQHPNGMCTVARVLLLCTKSPTYMCLPASLYVVHTEDPYIDNVPWPGDRCNFDSIADDTTTRATEYANDSVTKNGTVIGIRCHQH